MLKDAQYESRALSRLSDMRREVAVTKTAITTISVLAISIAEYLVFVDSFLWFLVFLWCCAGVLGLLAVQGEAALLDGGGGLAWKFPAFSPSAKRRRLTPRCRADRGARGGLSPLDFVREGARPTLFVAVTTPGGRHESVAAL
ncbi:hypothetical protein AB6Q56_21940 [Dechloromonas sp. ARDL1]|uniref:hypothetical protein n=1 Tax=Dechloromonas sp. ARDL1 TaxID=3322121 RepID=UPI003DA77CDE